MRVLLADDNRLLLEGLTNLLSAHGLDVVATAADGYEAVDRTRVHRPDVVLMDVRMPRCDGLCATRLIKAELPETRIVMLTTSAEDGDLFEAIRSGASGYLLKDLSGEELLQSLAGLEEGTPPLSPGFAARLMQEFARRTGSARRPAPGGARSLQSGPSRPGTGGRPAAGQAGPSEGDVLTQRQAQVLELVAAGLTYKEVASELGLSERTVRYHMAEIMDRLHLEHRSQVLAYAGEIGLVGHRE